MLALLTEVKYNTCRTSKILNFHSVVSKVLLKNEDTHIKKEFIWSIQNIQKYTKYISFQEYLQQ